MLVSELRDQARIALQDTAEPYLWGDDELLLYLNDGVNEACARARLIEDRTTDAYCEVTLAMGQDTYELDPVVLDVKRVVGTTGWPLRPTSVEEEDSTGAKWEDRTGTPRAWIQTGGKLRVLPTPTAAEAGQTLRMTVYRLPEQALANDSDEPEVPAKWHMRLLDWVYHRAYSKQDTQTANPAKAAEFEARFTVSFGPRPDANVERKRRDRRPPRTKMIF